MNLEVVGRHTLFFDDDSSAAFVNSGDALVEWHSLQIDRYDVRHLLSAPPPPRRRNRSYEPRTSDDPSLEFLIDQERYLDLPSESDQPELEEEEEKPSSSGGYRSVAFSYGNTDDSTDQKNTDVGMEASGYLPPFPVPGDIVQNLPPTEKLHQIIARTATFVSKHGGQTEIILRVKQGDNPTFGFLMPDHHLHAYFRYLVENPELLHNEIDEKSQDERKTAGSEHNYPGNVGGALSLLGSIYGSGEEDGDDASPSHDAKVVESVGTAAAKDESISSKPILSNKDKVPAVKKNSSIIGSKSKSVRIKKADNSGLFSAADEKLKNHDTGATSKQIVEPPPELKRLIDKLVEFVMRNGKQFEATLLEQDSKLERLSFLLPSNQYHPYYLNALQASRESKVNGKSIHLGQEDQSGRGMSTKVSVLKENNNSYSTSEFCDVPYDSDRKEKFKMVIGKLKKEAQETEKESQSGFTVDAAAAAAILQAATKGIKSSGLQIIRSTATSSHGAAGGVDSSDANLTEEQKLKAERLKKAKMFVAMLKSGVVPSRTGTSRGSSAEPMAPGMLKAADAVSRASQEREGSLVPAVVDKPADEGQSERGSKRKYRSRSIGSGDDEEDSCREGHSSRMYRSKSRRHQDDENENAVKKEGRYHREKRRQCRSHSTEGESSEENKDHKHTKSLRSCHHSQREDDVSEGIREEERDKIDNEHHSDKTYRSRSRRHRDDEKIGNAVEKDRKHHRRRHRSHSSSEESNSSEESDEQDTEHKHYKAKHHSRHSQRYDDEREGAYKEERDKERRKSGSRRSYGSRSRRHEDDSDTRNAVEKEDKYHRRKHSSHSSFEENGEESDTEHQHSKLVHRSSHSNHKDEGRDDIYKKENGLKRSRNSRRSHHSSSESSGRHSSEHRKKYRSSHTSHHSRDRHRHKNVHSSKDKESRRRHKHDSSSDDETEHRASSDKPGKELRNVRDELEEGEISSKVSHDESKGITSGDAKRGISIEVTCSEQRGPSQPSETTEVPDDLRAKIRAMLMATRS